MNFMVMAYIHGVMEINIKETSKKIKWKVKEYIRGLMEINIKEILLTILNLVMAS